MAKNQCTPDLTYTWTTLWPIKYFGVVKWILSLADFFHLGGTPPPPTLLAENHFAKKPLAEMGGTPPP